MTQPQHVLDQLNSRGRTATFHTRNVEGATVQDAAHNYAEDLLDDLDAGLIDTESAYSVLNRRHVEYMLGGGGPSMYFHVVYDSDGDIDHAYVEFNEGVGALVKLPDWAASKIVDALKHNEPRADG